MRKLYLLRHAEAPMSFDIEDKERPLSAHGIDQATKVGAALPSIDHVLCSSATRTKMTCDTAQQGGAQFGKIEYLDELYNAPAGTLFDAIKNCSAQNIMVIAHNPGIHILANTLAKEETNPDLEKLRLFYNPATLSVFDCNIENWKNIQPAENMLTDLIIPE